MNDWTRRPKLSLADKRVEQEKKIMADGIAFGTTLRLYVEGDGVQIRAEAVGNKLRDALVATLHTMVMHGLEPADMLAIGAAVMQTGHQSCIATGVPQGACDAFVSIGTRVGDGLALELSTRAEAHKRESETPGKRNLQ